MLMMMEQRRRARVRRGFVGGKLGVLGGELVVFSVAGFDAIIRSM